MSKSETSNPTKHRPGSRGDIITLALVFGGIFLMLFSSLLGFTMLQLKQSRQKAAWNEALTIAEAGVNYYRWHLAHAPSDLQDGQTGCCASPPCAACGPYEHAFSDPESGAVGTFSLELSGSQQCGETTAVTIRSTGWSNDFPNTKRTVQVRYIKPTVADFAYLINSDVWAGADREIKGPYHSNGGIRMDGENKSTVTSGRDEWVCTSSFGCSSCPTSDGCRLVSGNCTCPGVFTTANGNEELFSWGVPPFDFDGITMDLATIKRLADDEGRGLYFEPAIGKGYHFVLQSNRTFRVYRVTEVNPVYAYDSDVGWYWQDSDILTEIDMGQYDMPEDCSIVFVEDNLWIEGELSGKLTIVSADLTIPITETNVWITGNIEYTDRESGNDGLTVVAQNKLLIGLEVPDRLELHGAYIAQNGHFGRDHYACSWYPDDCKKDYLEIFGSVVSSGREGTKWTSGTTWVSGFETRENIYDAKQSFGPCPFLPTTSDEYTIKEWQEVTP